jgi:predicted sulfurtransferase
MEDERETVYDHLAWCDDCGDQLKEADLRQCPNCYDNLCRGCWEDHGC